MENCQVVDSSCCRMLHFIIMPLTLFTRSIASVLIYMFNWYAQAYFSTVMARGSSFSSRCSSYSHCVWCNRWGRICASFLCLLSSLLVLDIPQIILKLTLWTKMSVIQNYGFSKKTSILLLQCLGIPEKNMLWTKNSF